MGETTATGTRCPRCSAAVRPGAPWCTQCYAPLGDAAAAAPSAPPLPAVPRQPPAPSPAVEPAAPAVAAPPPVPPPALPPAPPPALPPALPTAGPAGTWPCTTCSAPNDLADAACQGCGTPFLAAARGDRPTIVLPVVGDLLALSPVRRIGLALGAVIAFVVLTALLALLLA